MPRIRIISTDEESRVLILEYRDQPRYEVRLYRPGEEPRTLLFTDRLGKAEALRRRASGQK